MSMDPMHAEPVMGAESLMGAVFQGCSTATVLSMLGTIVKFAASSLTDDPPVQRRLDLLAEDLGQAALDLEPASRPPHLTVVR